MSSCRSMVLAGLVVLVTVTGLSAQTPSPRPPTPVQIPRPTPGPPAQGQPAPAPPPPAPAPAQEPATPLPAPAAPAGGYIICGQAQPVPSRLPPAGSGPVVLAIAPCFEKQGNLSAIDPATYLYYIKTRPSLPSQNQWVSYDQKAEDQLLEDFRSLWATNFLDDLSVEVNDYKFANGVIGKLITYQMEERQRVKIVDYEGSKEVETTKIDEKLREENVTIRLDSFIDDGVIRRVKGIVRGMLSEKGYLDSQITHEIKPVSGGPKLVHLTFKIAEGPKYKIKDIDFIGNKAMSDGKLKGKMKETKEEWFLSFITGRGTYKDDKYAEDAEKVVGFYRDEGYLRIRVDNPELRVLKDSADKKTRYVQLRIPVTEGPRYRVGNFNVTDNKVIRSEALAEIFKLKQGDHYSEKNVRKGLEKARELYGSVGYFEFTAYPEFKFRDVPESQQGQNQPPPPPTNGNGAPAGPAIVDVTMHMQEGEQFFVNRITFVGNTTTRDNVIRREMRLVENGVFNTEALKYSVKRINQLGYFKQLEGNENQAVKVDKTPNEKNKVDVTLTVEEQNRNQLTFGAGVSQFEGAFVQFAFQTSNFLGRGETLSASVLTGRRYRDYQLSFTEPYLFDRPITGGLNVFNRTIRYIGAYTQKTSGGNLLFGFPLKDFTRGFIGYSYERVGIEDLNIDLSDPSLVLNPFLADALLIQQGGRRTISRITPSVVYNTVDNPIFPSAGARLTASFELAGVGGNTAFYKPRVEAIKYFQLSRRTSLGMRGQFEFVAPYAGTEVLPIFERLVLGGEYSIRGYDIRTIGPRDEVSGLVIGGNKSLLFNAEYLIQIAGPVRLVLFYDTGQVQDDNVNFQMGDFISSTGAEIRFFMPVLNVPFRLIFARNINYEGILDNNYNPEKKNRFRFAVGTTF